MEALDRIRPIAVILMFIGALSWGIFGLFGTNVLAEVFGTGTLADVVYVLIGVAALTYLPRLFDELHLGESHGAKPHGA